MRMPPRPPHLSHPRPTHAAPVFGVGRCRFGAAQDEGESVRTWANKLASCSYLLVSSASAPPTRVVLAAVSPAAGLRYHGAHNAARRLDHGLRLYRLVEPAARQPVVHHATAFRTAVHAASSGRHGGVLGNASVRGADLPRPRRVADRAEGPRDGAHLPGAKCSNGQREAPWNVQAGRPIPCPILCPYTSLLCTHAYLL